MDLEFSILTIVLLSVALLLLPILALVHIFRSNFKGRSKLIWVLIIIFLPFFGSVLYFLIGKRYRKYNPE